MDDLITLSQAAETYGLTTQTIRRWAEQGKIEFVKPDRVHVYVRKSEMNVAVPHVGRLLEALEASCNSDVLHRSND